MAIPLPQALAAARDSNQREPAKGHVPENALHHPPPIVCSDLATVVMLKRTQLFGATDCYQRQHLNYW